MPVIDDGLPNVVVVGRQHQLERSQTLRGHVRQHIERTVGTEDPLCSGEDLRVLAKEALHIPCNAEVLREASGGGYDVDKVVVVSIVGGPVLLVVTPVVLLLARAGPLARGRVEAEEIAGVALWIAIRSVPPTQGEEPMVVLEVRNIKK